MNNRLVELLKTDNCSQLSIEEYEEMLELLDEARERVIRLREGVLTE